MQVDLMCCFLSHQVTEYTLSGLFSAASADSSEHVSLVNGRETKSYFGCGLGKAKIGGLTPKL